MTRIKMEDILKPGAKLEVKKIDFNDPFVKEVMREHRKALREMKKIVTWRYEGWWRRII